MALVDLVECTSSLCNQYTAGDILQRLICPDHRHNIQPYSMWWPTFQKSHISHQSDTVINEVHWLDVFHYHHHLLYLTCQNQHYFIPCHHLEKPDLLSMIVPHFQNIFSVKSKGKTIMGQPEEVQLSLLHVTHLISNRYQTFKFEVNIWNIFRDMPLTKNENKN